MDEARNNRMSSWQDGFDGWVDGGGKLGSATWYRTLGFT